MKKPYRLKLVSLLVVAASLSLIFVNCNKGINDDLKTVEQQSENVTPNYVPTYCDDLPDPCADPACARYYFCDRDLTVVYAGVPVTYESANGILRFNSANDFAAVANQLEAALETWNDNYENQYASLTPEQLDDVDDATGFDEFKPLRDFEALFGGFLTKRRAIEIAENTWMAADMTGTDPDDIDHTFDDEVNTLCNSNYQVKIGSTVYSITAANTPVPVLNSPASVQVINPCVTNKKKKIRVTSPDGSRRFKLKVAINSWYVRSGVKGKVVSYKKKSNGKWKRSRTRLAVYNGGTVYNNGCSLSAQFSLRKPSSGYKKRKQLKNVYRGYGTIWTTKYGELYASFEAQNIMTGDVVL